MLPNFAHTMFAAQKLTRANHVVSGKTAITYLTSYELYDVKPRIVEHVSGIDVDNAGRLYDHEKDCGFTDVMWSVLNHIAYNGVTDKGIHADVADVLNGATTNKLLWFHLEDSDPESYGRHYEFIY